MNNIISCFLRVTKYVALFFLEVTMTVFCPILLKNSKWCTYLALSTYV